MSQNEKLEQQIENKEEIQKELQRKIEVLEKDLAKPCAQCANYESQVVKLQSQLKVIDILRPGQTMCTVCYECKLQSQLKVIDILRPG